MAETPRDLPIVAHREALLSAIIQAKCLVVIGETGSGKTTQLPKYLLQAGLTDQGRPIVVTQPRKIAAISVSRLSSSNQQQAYSLYYNFNIIYHLYYLYKISLRIYFIYFTNNSFTALTHSYSLSSPLYPSTLVLYIHF